MEHIKLAEDLALKYPCTLDALQYCYKDVVQQDSLLPVLQGRMRRYWPAGGVNSEVFNARFPDKKLLLRMAKQACRRRIIYWHPWHMEVTHRVYSLEKDIDWLTPPTGDHEWIDSLVRFTHMIDLAAAYELTHGKKYLHAFEHYLNSFSATRNKPGRHWKYLVNVAVRLINLVRAYDLVSRTGSLSLSVHMTVLENIILDVRFLLAALNNAAGNGAFFAATALLVASEYLGDIIHVDGWQPLAEKKLYEIINTEIQSDWMEAEQVPMYHGQVVLALLDYCVVLAANGRPVNSVLKDTITGMLDTLYGLCDPEGIIPPIGDSDRFPVSYIIDLYNAVFMTRYGESPDKTVGAVASGLPKHCELTTFEASGWVVARWDYDLETQGYLLFDCSGKPKNEMSSHSHADDLQFLLHTTKGPVFTDPGRFTYCTDFKAYFPFTRRRIYPAGRFHRLYSFLFPDFMELRARNWKEYFRGTLSHNTISSNGANQPGYAHRDGARSRAGLLQQETVGPLVLLKGYLDTRGNAGDNEESEAVSRSGYQHQRTILGFLPHFWIIVDQLKAEQENNWVSSYHLDAGARVSFEADRLHLEAGRDVHNMHFMSSSAAGHTLSIKDDWVSRIYNKKLPSKTVRATINNASEAVLITVIHSHVSDVVRIDAANTIRVASGAGDLTEDIYHIRLTSGDSVTRLIVNPGGKALKYDGLEFNAMISMETRFGTHLREAGFLGGTFLRSDDFSLTCSAQEAGVFRSFDFPE
jgi:hypothetical protein